MHAPRIGIVSSGCLSTGPRVVKEADALSAAGYDVSVVGCHWVPGQAEWDARLAAPKPWAWSPCSLRTASGRRTGRAVAGVLVRNATRAIARATGPLAPIDEAALSSITAPLWWHAAGARADLFLAHNLAALPVAARLAGAARVPLAFDAEDDHLMELPASEQHTIEARLRDTLLARYLPRCSYVTTPSDGIAEALRDRYGIPRPVVVHNAFPLADRARCDGRRVDRTHGGFSLYWCSQSIGLDRGLQDAIRATARLPGEVHLHLRGDGPEPVRAELRRTAHEAGLDLARLHLHPQVHPDELLSRTMEHDIGFALEPPVSENKVLTVTNKVFLYLVAGLAVAASDTPGQRGLLAAEPEVGFVYRHGDVTALAHGLQRLMEDPGRLARAKAASLAAAEARWCWEREQEHLLAVVARVLPRPAPAAASSVGPAPCAH